jgi:hypothetical protein
MHEISSNKVGQGKRPRHAEGARQGRLLPGQLLGALSGGSAAYRGFPVFKTLTLPCYLEVPGISVPDHGNGSAA